MLNKKLLYRCITTFILLIVFFTLFTSFIQVNASTAIIDPKDPNYEQGNYELNDLVRVIINVANFILSIVGSLALLFFIYGGVMFLISAGSSEKITQAKQILVGAVIGIVIVFASYTIISFIMAATCFDVDGTHWNQIGTSWFNKTGC